jgi:hypothetical protein
VSRYRKTIAAFGGFLGVAAAALADGEISGAEGSGLIVSAAGVLAVYLFPNAQNSKDPA